MTPTGRRVLVSVVILTALVLVGAAGAVAAGLLRPAAPAYRTAEVVRGDVSETVDLTGSVTRVNQATTTFPTSGTVTWLGVQVGDRVTKGQRLARIAKLPLQVALVQAQAELTQARATYHQDLKAADDAAKGSSATASPEPSPTDPPSESESPAPSPGGQPGGDPSGGAGGPGGSGGTAALLQLMSTLRTQLAYAQRVCATPAPTPSPSASPGATSSPSASPSATPSPTPTPTPTPPVTPSPTPTASTQPPVTTSPTTSTASPTPTQPSTPAPTLTPTSSPTPRPPATPPGTTLPTDPLVCLAALRAVLQTQTLAAQALTAASAELTRATAQLSAAAEAQAQAMADATRQQTEAMARAQAEMLAQARSAEEPAAGSTGSLRVQLARDLVAITRAQQAVDKARRDLAGATLTAPLAGVVGRIDVTEQSVASTADGITIVGSGASEVTVAVPLSLMGKVAVGQTAAVVPPGGTTPVTGTVTAVSPLPSTSSGADPTYATVIRVRRSPVTLTSGVSATVRIAVARARNVLIVPVSATVPIDEQRASVRVLSPTGAVEEITVTTGVTGIARIEIVAGLDLGQRVIIADPTKPLPGLDLFGSEDRAQAEDTSGGAEPGSGEPGPPADESLAPASPEPTR